MDINDLGQYELECGETIFDPELVMGPIEEHSVGVTVCTDDMLEFHS